MYNKALQIATRAHSGQVDKGGQPYINHPVAVANMVKTGPAKVVALLHDVVEDSAVSIQDLAAAGFGHDIVSAVDAITKRPGEEYNSYLKRVAANPIAREVKLADLAHNMDTGRLESVTAKDQGRIAKYQYATQYLHTN